MGYSFSLVELHTALYASNMVTYQSDFLENAHATREALVRYELIPAELPRLI